MRFYGQPQGLSLRILPFVVHISRNAEDSVPYEKSLFFKKFDITSKRREQAPALPCTSSLFTKLINSYRATTQGRPYRHVPQAHFISSFYKGRPYRHMPQVHFISSFYKGRPYLSEV